MDLEEVEVRLLLEGIFLKYGYDFRDYSETSMRRRVQNLLRKTQVPSVSELQGRILHDSNFFYSLIGDFTVSTSEMFRDPHFYRALREEVLPHLRSFPSLNVWHAGCSTGEEIYSTAILFKEEGLCDRSTFYATDIHPQALEAAQRGAYPVAQAKKFIQNYQDAGGREAFANYYSAQYGYITLDPSLRENVTFLPHNLVTDASFAETHLILCRNVLIYFNRPLQDRVLSLFASSLRHQCFLALGSKESVRFSESTVYFDDFREPARIYRRNLAPVRARA